MLSADAVGGMRVGTEGKAAQQNQGDSNTLLPSVWHVLVATSPRPGCLLDTTYQLSWYQLALSKALGKTAVENQEHPVHPFPGPREERRNA